MNILMRSGPFRSLDWPGFRFPGSIINIIIRNRPFGRLGWSGLDFLDCSWKAWDHLQPPWLIRVSCDLWPASYHLGASYANLGSFAGNLDHFSLTLGISWSIWSHLEDVLRLSWAYLGPSWDHPGNISAYLGTSCACPGPVLGVSWASLTDLEAVLGPLGAVLEILLSSKWTPKLTPMFFLFDQISPTVKPNYLETPRNLKSLWCV